MNLCFGMCAATNENVVLLFVLSLAKTFREPLMCCYLLGDPEVTANIYCKSRNLPKKDTQNYSTDLR